MPPDDIAEAEAEKGGSTSSVQDYTTVAAITQAAVILALLTGMGVIIYK